MQDQADGQDPHQPGLAFGDGHPDDDGPPTPISTAKTINEVIGLEASAAKTTGPVPPVSSGPLRALLGDCLPD